VSVTSDTWRAVATLEDLWEGEMTVVEVDGRAVVLMNVDGNVYAYEDECPHLGTPLSAGTLEGGVLTCSAHEWVFDCRSGHGVNPASACLNQCSVRVDEEVIYVRTTEEL
jgi:toluene monooxygenase system ferredoxin subunit